MANSSSETTPLDRAKLLDVLAAMDEWLGNSEGLMIEDVIEWRDLLAVALGKDKW